MCLFQSLHRYFVFVSMAIYFAYILFGISRQIYTMTTNSFQVPAYSLLLFVLTLCCCSFLLSVAVRAYSLLLFVLTLCCCSCLLSVAVRAYSMLLFVLTLCCCSYLLSVTVRACSLLLFVLTLCCCSCVLSDGVSYLSLLLYLPSWFICHYSVATAALLNFGTNSKNRPKKFYEIINFSIERAICCKNIFHVYSMTVQTFCLYAFQKNAEFIIINLLKYLKKLLR